MPVAMALTFALVQTSRFYRRARMISVDPLPMHPTGETHLNVCTSVKVYTVSAIHLQGSRDHQVDEHFNSSVGAFKDESFSDRQLPSRSFRSCGNPNGVPSSPISVRVENTLPMLPELQWSRSDGHAKNSSVSRDCDQASDPIRNRLQKTDGSEG